MRIRIDSPTTFVITEQSDRNFKDYEYRSSIGKIIVDQESYPEIIYRNDFILVFVRGIYEVEDYKPLKVKSPEHMPHILKALKEFCTFNEEPFEIESCIL